MTPNVYSQFKLNPATKETPHSFKGHQLENKLLYIVIYMAVWGKVQLLKAHVFGQIVVNLNQFRKRYYNYKFDVKL